MTATAIFQVDSFSDRLFAGNPAAVVPLDGPREPGWMQSVAAEMNLSETAFLVPRPGAGAAAAGAADGWDLRWFTPTVEVDLCGHATLASAHVLWESGVLPAGETARFHSRSGLLTAVQRDGWIELDFPATPPEPAPEPAGLRVVLGVDPLEVRRSRFDYLVEIASAEKVRSLAPDLLRLATLPVRGVIVTAAEGEEFDFVSRFFAPAAGVPEDPVTGSAHCALGPYWQERLGKSEMLAFQASKRGGVVRVRVEGDRVKLGGQAITVLRGELAG
jgi:PhzF family phenazine biosynthesis protein